MKSKIQASAALSLITALVTSTSALAAPQVNIRCVDAKNQQVHVNLQLTGESVTFKGKMFSKDECSKTVSKSPVSSTKRYMTISCKKEVNGSTDLAIDLSIFVDKEGQLTEVSYSYQEGYYFYSEPGPSGIALKCSQSELL